MVEDPGGEKSSAWRSQRLCLRAGGSATHILIVQDDATVCPFFSEAVALIVAAKPEAAIALFLPGAARETGHHMLLAMKRRQPWAQWSPREFWPTVASIYPRALAEQAADYGDSRPKAPRNDDSIMGEFLRGRRVPAFVTVPSLVEHLDDVPSLIGRRYMAGLNAARNARFFIGDRDPRTIKW